MSVSDVYFLKKVKVRLWQKLSATFVMKISIFCSFT